MKIVCDSNVFFSAIVFGGIIEEILNAANNREIYLYTSNTLLLELARILKEKAGWEDYKVNYTISGLKDLCFVVNPKVKVKIIKTDESDNRVLECASESGADYIVTGDKKHILPLKKFKGIPILSPRDFLSQVLYKLP